METVRSIKCLYRGTDRLEFEIEIEGRSGTHLLPLSLSAQSPCTFSPLLRFCRLYKLELQPFLKRLMEAAEEPGIAILGALPQASGATRST
ncbi:MAG: hypothetical protein AB1405_01020 [Bdellovibrionota bacterium]